MDLDSFNGEIKFAALGVMAVVPIILGSYASLPNVLNKKREAEKVGMEEAKSFPLYGSLTLLSLFLVLKYLPKEWVNLVVNIYFASLGVMAVANTVHDLVSFAAPSVLKRVKSGSFMFQYDGVEWMSAAFDTLHLAGLAIGLPVGLVYGFSKHWILNNILGECFSYFAVKSLNLDSFRTGMLMLAGLFFYDIFWVFGTDVMVSVAKGLDAPIKVVFPLDFTAEEFKFTLLGLGDIVIPGIFIALALRFDYQQSGAGRPLRATYFKALMVSYVAALIATVTAMRVFKSAQPALLYLSPACIFTVLGLAAARGDLKALWSFNGYQPEEEETDEDGDKVAENKAGSSKEELKKDK